MHKDVHFAALKAAARVAFGVAVLGGCSEAANEEESLSTESEINKAPCPSKADAGSQADAQPDAKPSCDELLASTFGPPEDDRFQTGPAKAASEDVKTCCQETLTKERAESWNIPHRWSCCNVLGSWSSTVPGVGMACTPWGPPVPPRMRAVA